MNNHLEQLRERALKRYYPICINKYKLVCESMKQSQGLPIIMRRAMVLDNVLRNIRIFIDDCDLIVGNGASKTGALEIEPDYGQWDKDEVDALRAEGYSFDEADEKELYALNEQYQPTSIQDAMLWAFQGNEQMEAFMRSGMTLPPWRLKVGKQAGGGLARSGLGLSPGMVLMCMDYEQVINKGIAAMVEECDAELAAIDFNDKGSYDRAITLKAMKMSLQAVIAHAQRYAQLAEEMAETAKEPRKQELLEIAEICRWVPANKPRTFREALQFFWFLFLVMTPGATASMGRFDQYMYPFYKADIKAGRTTDEEVIELLEMLRYRNMEIRGVGGKQTRKRQSGMAKWHNMTICGVKRDGSDATNELSYLILEAAKRTRCPHHTITMRIAPSTPDAIIQKGLELQRMGLSLPAFVGDKSYIDFFHGYGTSLEDARDYCMTGCLDGEIQGRSITMEVEMFGVPRVLDVYLNNGIDAFTGLQLGHVTGDLDRFATYEEFRDDFLKELEYFIRMGTKRCSIAIYATQQNFPDPLKSAFMHDGVREGIDLHRRRFVIDNYSTLNPVGMVNLGNSLGAIKSVVYDQKLAALSDLKKALDANWEGYESLHQACKDVLKYGNGDAKADAFVADLYQYWIDCLEKIPAVPFGYNKSTAISVTSHQPAGELCGATPDGRCAHDILADGCASPMAGTDENGPLKVFSSALKIPQDKFQAMLLNMKFHPSALKTDEDLNKLASAMKIYFANGGKHVQFVICDQETLKDAKVNPERHSDLMVRVAGYSAYFVQLGGKLQDEVISRTSNTQVS